MQTQVKSGFLPQEVEDELLRFMEEVEKCMNEVIKCDEDATRKRINYDLSYARAVLTSTGKNAEERRATALLAVEVEHREVELAELLLRTAKRRLAEVERKIEILRTFSANLRSQVV